MSNSKRCFNVSVCRDNDFFLGDFSSPSKLGQVSSKPSSCGVVAAKAIALISYGQETWPGKVVTSSLMKIFFWYYHDKQDTCKFFMRIT